MQQAINPNAKQQAKDRIQAAFLDQTAKDKLKADQIELTKNAKINLLNLQQQLLERQIDQQKKLMEKLVNPNTDAHTKKTLLNASKSLSSDSDKIRSKIKIIENEIEEHNKRLTIVNVEREITNTEKILNSALADCVSRNSESTNQVRLKLYRLQEQAEKMGVYKKQREEKLAELKAINTLAISKSIAQRSIDRRPRKLKVTNFHKEEVNEVIVHLSKFGDIECLQEKLVKYNSISVEYTTRIDAESAFKRGVIFKDKQLKIDWEQAKIQKERKYTKKEKRRATANTEKLKIESMAKIPNKSVYKFRKIIIDGSNVAVCHGKGPRKVFSSKGIKLAIDKFKELGATNVKAVLPAFREHPTNKRRRYLPTVDYDILKNLEKEKHILYVPSRANYSKQNNNHYDDEYIIELASQTDAVVISNDHYKDLHLKAKVDNKTNITNIIEKHICGFMFDDDVFIPAVTPYEGIPLEQFLRSND